MRSRSMRAARRGDRRPFPLPTGVGVTRGPTSKRRPWFPPVAHTHTGRLCSAGSGRHPAAPTSTLVRSPPTPPLPIGRGSGLPLPSVYLGADASSVQSHLRGVGRPRAHPRARGASESDDRVSVAPVSAEEERGPPRCLDRPLAACRGRSPRRVRIPPDPPRPDAEKPPSPSRNSTLSAPGMKCL